MPVSSQDLLSHFRFARGKTIDLTLRPSYTKLLVELGSPHTKLPAPILVAGTNGKGSTIAFLRAIIEACGKTAHIYTSPHLIQFHERIRVAGRLIDEESLVSLLEEITAKAEPGQISIFEAGTAAALTAFARTPADCTLLEVGLGGRLDATNIVPNLVACAISRLSFDHREYLGETMHEIAGEKAGIMRAQTPCFISHQPSSEAQEALHEQAAAKGAKLYGEGETWSIERHDDGSFDFLSATRTLRNLPRPALLGEHQYHNAGLAIACATALPFPVPDEAFAQAMRRVQWPGRLQQLTSGKLHQHLEASQELWLDGGHNDSAGEMLGRQFQRWHESDGKPLHLIFGMINSKKPQEFTAPLLRWAESIETIYVDGEIPGFPAEELAATVARMGGKNVAPSKSLHDALEKIVRANGNQSCRIVICGSLYLVGEALRQNGSTLS
ncbi:MAG: bifunctional folylpolyglutamate synthase/dihydrofolate synthase [Proteobacteria bacterium]|nr:bifunctional folylpolyglutamate synthase/dihydrofolate synthase [Pseudomonadota bacterium]